MTAGRICSLGELQDFSLVVHGIPCKLLNAQLQLGLGCALSYWLLLQHVRLHFGHSLVVKNSRAAVSSAHVVCRWTVAEAEEYWKFARGTAMRRSSQEWKFDLSWLSSNNYTIPPKLQQLCRQ